MIITFLGVGSAINTKHMGTSLLVDETTLIDAPPFVSNRLLARGFDIASLDAIIITHLHADHFFGLPLLLTGFLLRKRDRRLRIYGPKGFRETLESLMRLAFSEASTESVLAATNPEFVVIEHGKAIGQTAVSLLTPARVSHGSVETYGMIIESGPVRVFFTSDTQLFEGLEEIVRDCQYCIADGTTSDISISGHMSYVQIRDLAKEYQRTTFFVTHRSEYAVPGGEPNILFPVDGDTFDLCHDGPPTLISQK